MLFGEKATPRSQNQRVDQKDILVDEIVPHQRLNEFSAAEDDEIPVQFLLESGYGLSGVAFQERGIGPRKRLRERG